MLFSCSQKDTVDPRDLRLLPPSECSEGITDVADVALITSHNYRTGTRRAICKT